MSTVENKSEAKLITNAKHLRDTAFTLKNLFKAGSLSAAEILVECGNMDLRLKSALHVGAKCITNSGWSFTRAVSRIFSDSELIAIKAGEESQSLEAVFEKIWRSAKTQVEIQKVLKGLYSPLWIALGGVVVSICFYIFLLPSLYLSLAASVKDYKPSLMIEYALIINKTILNNVNLSISCLVGFLLVIGFIFSNATYRQRITYFLLSYIIRIKPVGMAYSNLKFGVMAEYLSIISHAGLDMDVRLKLVTELLPSPIQSAFLLFRSEVMTKGLKFASLPVNRNESDPRTDLVMWPPYFRLALAEANEVDMTEPMAVYGDIMIQDSIERIQTQIQFASKLAMLVVGVFICVPVGLLYGTMGEVLFLRMSLL